MEEKRLATREKAEERMSEARAKTEEKAERMALKMSWKMEMMELKREEREDVREDIVVGVSSLFFFSLFSVGFCAFSQVWMSFSMVPLDRRW